MFNLLAKKWFLLFVFSLPFSVNSQIITTIAGTGAMTNTGDNGPATAATVYIPEGGAFDKAGNYYFVVSVGQKVRKISSTGIITTVAGTGTTGTSGDGIPATAANLNGVIAVAVDTFGNVYIVEGINKKIRKVDISTGLLYTVAGNGTSIYNGDNMPATDAAIGPRDVAIDRLGNIYIADNFNNRVRKVNTAGIISTIGGDGNLGISGIGGPATSAQIQPAALCIDQIGNIYVADNQPGQTRVCKIDLSGNLILIAGDPSNSIYNGDNIPATNAHISPVSIAIDKCHNLYIADATNNRIRKVDNANIIYTVAGTGVQGFNGDNGAATSAKLHWPYSVAVDSTGNLFIADSYNYRIRKVTFDPPFCWPVSVQNNAEAKNISIYPNPVNDELHIDGVTKEQEYEIYSMVGTILQQDKLKEGNNTIPLQRLPAGMYMVEVSDNAVKRTMTKIVKQ